ncbi:carboxypeptidase-like regulatory domain-containing protein [Inquilinus sp. KBS0705]|nr:carboxypeptidase-like regulatory domain-containing protein [Inquilinus sp. KBS0705]
MKRYLLLVLFITTYSAYAQQQYTLSGQITGSKNEDISFTSVYIRNSSYGTTANQDGRYRLKLNPGTYTVIYRHPGQQEQSETITITDHDDVHNVQLQDEVFRFSQVSNQWKINRDPGDTIIRRVINNNKARIQEFKGLSCAAYVKGVQTLLSSPKSLTSKAVTKALDLDSNGRGILYQSELLANFNYGGPGKIKEITIASKTTGTNTAFSYTKASDLQLNVYKNVITIDGLSSRGFVSPFASNAFFYYRYKLIGSSVQNGLTIDKIEVIPRRQYGQFFRGNVYIVESDWRIYSIDLYLSSKTTSLNFVDTLQIKQQYVPITDSVWMPVSVQFNFVGSVLGFKFGGYYEGIFNNYKINPPFADGFFTGELLKVDTAATLKSKSYWEDNRPVPLTRLESRDYEKKDSIAAYKKTDEYLDALQHTKNGINYPGYLIFGYYASNRSNRDSLYVYPFLQTFYYNTVEGFGINAKVRYTRTIDDLHSLSVTPALRYGFSNKLFSANMLTEYKYDPFHNSKLWLSFGSDVLDLNNVGTRSLYFNTLSTLLSENNYVKYYRSQYGGVGFQRELANGILWTAGLTYASRSQLYNTAYGHIFNSKDREYTSNNPLAPPGTPADDRSILFPTNQALTFNTSVAFTFDQKYITRPTGKFNLPSKYPTLTLNYRKGISKVLGSDVDYDFASADISQYNIRIGLSGFSSFKLTGGDYFNNKTLYFMDYYHYLGNQGTTFDPTYIGSFHFLPFYTYSTNGAFFEAHYQHNFAGSLLGKVPFMRKLKLEEIIGANFLTTKGNSNYREFYVGLQRLIFRVDYGISYAGNKKYIQGIRIFYGIR